MRPLGYTLAAVTFAFCTSAQAQPPGPPPLPPAQPVVPASVTLDDHLMNWERTMAGVKSFHVEIQRTVTDNVFKKEKKYGGTVLCMKPNLAILRLDFLGDPTKADYEALICDGKSLFKYDGLEKTVTEFKLNPLNNPGASDNLMLDFLSGMKSKDAKDRFELAVYKEDANYVYLSIKPKLGKDQQQFKMLNMALYGPKTQYPYLPCKVFQLNPNGDSETWDFSKYQLNIPGVDQATFKFVEVKGFKLVQAPTGPPPMRPGAPPMLPGSNGLTPGPGAVRP